MKWEELTEKHATEYVAFLNGYKASLERVNQDRETILEATNSTKDNIPENLKPILNNRLEDWQNEWGMYGSKFKEMRKDQQKEVNQYFDKQNLVYRLKKEIDNGKEKGKDNSGGR